MVLGAVIYRKNADDMEQLNTPAKRISLAFRFDPDLSFIFFLPRVNSSMVPGSGSSGCREPGIRL